jgi:membrane fusion protein, multidrug efflux system
MTAPRLAGSALLVALCVGCCGPVLAVSVATRGTATAATNGGTAEDNSPIRTQLVSQHDVMISSEVEGKVAQLPLQEGDAFKRGQLLVAFDCDLYAAQLRKVEATADAAAKVYAVNQKLSALHSVGELDVEQARAKAKEADAEAAYVRTTASRCQVMAPFSGRVSKRVVAQYEYVQAGKPLLQIVDTADLELKLIVPSRWLAWLRGGTALQVHIDDLNADYAANLVWIGARVDPVSRTLEAGARIKGNHPELLPGMSGSVHFPERR